MFIACFSLKVNRLDQAFNRFGMDVSLHEPEHNIESFVYKRNQTKRHLKPGDFPKPCEQLSTPYIALIQVFACMAVVV